MNVKWPPDPRYSFFTTQKYDDIHVFVIWEFLEGIYMNYVQGYTGCNQMRQTYVLFLRMFVSMLCTTKQHVLNIQLTDMWYLDISSLALTYIYLSRTNNNFWHWSTQEELKRSQILWLIFKKKSLVAKTIGRFFPELSHQKIDFWTELIPSLAGLMQ